MAVPMPTNCSWPYIKHPKWKGTHTLGENEFDFSSQGSAVDNADVIAMVFVLGLGLKLVLLHLAGRYSTRRRYFEPLASEVKAYSAEIGSTSRRTELDDSVLAGQEIPDYAASIILAMLDPLSHSYSYDLALHDYGRSTVASIVFNLLTRGMFYMAAYHVFTYCSRENFSCMTEFLYRRYNSLGLANLSTILAIILEMCQIVLLFNRVSREMLNNFGGSFQMWLLCMLIVTFTLAMFGTHTLFRIGLLLFIMWVLTMFWISLHLRFQFNQISGASVYAAWKLISYQTQQEQSLNLSDSLLYESNLVCIVLAAPLLHVTLRMSQTEYIVFQSLARRFKRKRVFVRAFILNFAYHQCHQSVLSALFTLNTYEGCDVIITGGRCHFSILSSAVQSHTALKSLLLTVVFYKSCWLCGFRVIGMAYMATKSRLMRSFVEFCLIGQRWVAMNRWRRQNGLILFRDCKLLDLESYVYMAFVFLMTGAAYSYCLDYVATDPSAKFVQYVNYLVLDLRYIFSFNALFVGMTFRRVTKFSITLLLSLFVLFYIYQLLWGDMVTEELLQYKVMGL